MKAQRKLVVALIVALTQINSLWYSQTWASSTHSLPNQTQLQKENDRDWIHFGFVALGDRLSIGHYEKSGEPISVTYLGCDYSTFLLEYHNASLRPIPMRSKDGDEWIHMLGFKVYKNGNPLDSATLAEYKGRELSKEEFVVRFKERRVRRIQYTRGGETITPTQFDLDPNYGYRPKRGEYDNFKWIEESVTEFPLTLDPRNYAEVVLEILDSNRDPLGPGRYYLTAEFDVRNFDLKLPPYHKKFFSASVGHFEVREVKTAEDQVNYHYIRAQGLTKEGSLAAAEAELIAGTTANPNSTRPWLDLGRFYEYDLKDYDKALAAYGRAKAISDRKGLKPPAENPDGPRMKKVDGKLLFDEPPYWPGTIERVQQKKLEKKL